MQLDRTNLQLLAALQRDGRLTISDLARLLNRGESTIRDRLAALQRSGVLRGYRAIVDPALLGYPVHAIVRARCETSKLGTLGKGLESIPQVIGAWTITGPKPIRIELRAHSLEELRTIVEERLQPMGLQHVETAVILETIVDPRPVAALNEATLRRDDVEAFLPPPISLAERPLP